MPAHKFRIAQIVNYRPAGRGQDAPHGNRATSAERRWRVRISDQTFKWAAPADREGKRAEPMSWRAGMPAPVRFSGPAARFTRVAGQVAGGRFNGRPRCAVQKRA